MLQVFNFKLSSSPDKTCLLRILLIYVITWLPVLVLAWALSGLKTSLSKKNWHPSIHLRHSHIFLLLTARLFSLICWACLVLVLAVAPWVLKVWQPVRSTRMSSRKQWERWSSWRSVTMPPYDRAPCDLSNGDYPFSSMVSARLATKESFYSGPRPI